MKELFKKVFSKKTATPIFVGFGAFAIVTFIVFPGLTAANTFINIMSVFIAVFVLVFVFYLLKIDKFVNPEHIEPGETELDYIPQEEIVKKKRNPKQSPEVKSEEPFVKTRKKTKTK